MSRLLMRARCYRGHARAALHTTIAYRTSVIVNLISSAVAVVALFYLWRAVLAGGQSLQGFGWEQMKSYLLVGFVTNSLMGWWSEGAMFDRVRKGSVVNDVVKPVDFQFARLAESIGAAAVEVVACGVAVVGVLLLFGGVSLPPGPHAVVFAVSFAAALLLKFLVVYLVSLLCVWTTGVVGLMFGRIAVTSLLSGMTIPLVFFPGWLRTTAELLPFRGIVAVPADVFLARVDLAGALALVGGQLVWIVVLGAGARGLWRVVARKVSVHGG